VTEAFLHYLWQFQDFEKKELKTTDSEELIVLNTGHNYLLAGPDFLNAKIRVGTLEWTGHVEMHIHASDWLQDKDQENKAYDTAILQEVWKNDKAILRNDGTPVPTLELQNKIDKKLLVSYQHPINQPQSIPCSNSLKTISSLLKTSQLEKAHINRLEVKANRFLTTFKKNKNDAVYSMRKDKALALGMDRALDFLSRLLEENNAIAREWTTLGWKASSAFAAQVLIELKNNFCSKRLWLNCTIGVNLVRTI
jgi:hypothetical protein